MANWTEWERRCNLKNCLIDTEYDNYVKIRDNNHEIKKIVDDIKKKLDYINELRDI